MLHTPAARGYVGHAMLHAPQCCSEVVTSVSQPLFALRSQSPKPVRHDSTAHWPPMHVGVALARLHALPHAPQWVVLPCVSTQPPAQHVRAEGHARGRCLRDNTASTRRNQAWGMAGS